MKPQFALSLSLDGIRLLLRAAGGWQSVGDVNLQTPKLAAELSALRAIAKKLTPHRLQTKLIIPNDQIRYLSIETGDLDEASRQSAARKALVGATPYPVDELAFDICAEGGATHIAAVAYDTLKEAEAFAVEHQFNPVSFVAAPEDQRFLGEPFFGVTAIYKSLNQKNGKVEPDGIRVVVTGSVDIKSQTDDTPKSAEAKQDDLALDESGSQPDSGKDIGLDNITLQNTNIPENAIAQADDDARSSPHSAAVAALGFASRRGSPIAKVAPVGGFTRGEPSKRSTRAVAAQVSLPPITPPKSATDSLRQMAAPAPDPPSKKPSEPLIERFMSRRKTPAVIPTAKVPAKPLVTPTMTAELEARRMTIFGARETDGGGKPRNPNLILMAILLIFLASVAAWATVFFDDGLARLFQGRERTLASTLPKETPAIIAKDVGATTITPEEATETDIELVAIDAVGLTAKESALLDALRDPLPDTLRNPPSRAALDAAALNARYAVTGIWPKSPEPTLLIEAILLDDLYIPSIDPISPALDAVALPAQTLFETDVQLAVVTSPAAAGTNFTIGDDGRVTPTTSGALSPDGFTVYLGRPQVVPPATPVRFANDPTASNTLTQIRPRARPRDLVAQNERATLGGLLRSELAGLRPRLRPASVQQKAEEQSPTDEADGLASPRATAQSARPNLRPRNFERIVARATQSPNRGSTAAAATASVAPGTVTPPIPSSASVSREATVRNAIKLNRINLIGVYGTPADRRALVRLSSGRYRKIQVGDRIDGGRVSAIGDDELRYQKGSRNLVLKIPKG